MCGSIWRPAVGCPLDWDRFHDDFTAGLASALGTAAEAVPWPDWNEDEVGALIEHYSTAEWIEHR